MKKVVIDANESVQGETNCFSTVTSSDLVIMNALYMRISGLSALNREMLVDSNGIAILRWMTVLLIKPERTSVGKLLMRVMWKKNRLSVSCGQLKRIFKSKIEKFQDFIIQPKEKEMKRLVVWVNRECQMK